MRRLAAALAVLLVLPLSGARAAPPGQCTGTFPDPRLSLRQSQYDVKPGQVVWLGGNLTRNGCPLGGEAVGLFVRTKPGPFHWFIGGRTDAKGGYTFGIHSNADYDVLAVFSGHHDYVKTLSQIHHVYVSATVDRDQPGFDYCDNNVGLVPASTPPGGVTVTLEGVPATLHPGQSVNGLYRITNGGATNLDLFTSYNGNAQFVLLENTRTGERPLGVHFTDYLVPVQLHIEPGESATVPARLQAGHCYYPRIHAGHFTTIGWLHVTPVDAEGHETGPGVNWYAAPLAVDVG